jgi:hypothetical protein
MYKPVSHLSETDWASGGMVNCYFRKFAPFNESLANPPMGRFHTV